MFHESHPSARREETQPRGTESEGSGTGSRSSSSCSTTSSEFRSRIRDEFDYRATPLLSSHAWKAAYDELAVACASSAAAGGGFAVGAEQDALEAILKMKYYSWKVPTKEELSARARARKQRTYADMTGEEKFKPATNSKSSHRQEYVKEQRPSSTVVRLTEYDLKRRQRWLEKEAQVAEKKRKTQEEDQLKECTFQPNLLPPEASGNTNNKHSSAGNTVSTACTPYSHGTVYERLFPKKHREMAERIRQERKRTTSLHDNDESGAV